MRIDKLKCSFTNKKVQRVNDKITIVTLKGYIPISPELMRIIPLKVHQWMGSLSSVDVGDSFFGLYITAKGKAVRAEEDEDNPILAERLAEAKAKYKVYKFLFKFCTKITQYYEDILYNTTYTKKGKPIIHYSLQSNWNYYNVLQAKEKIHITNLLQNESNRQSS